MKNTVILSFFMFEDLSPTISLITDEEQWEKDLEAEIQDFEVVDDTIDEQELDQLDLK